MDLMLYPIVLPIAVGLLCLAMPRRAKGIVERTALIVSITIFGLTVFLFSQKPLHWMWDANRFLRLDNLSGFVLLAVGLFGFLIVLYSIVFMRDKIYSNIYYAYLLCTIGIASGIVLANDLVLLAVFWGLSGLTLYLMIGIAGAGASAAAKKALVIVGGADSLMILGIAIVWFLMGSFTIDRISLPVVGLLPVIAFLCLAIAAFAKVGAMPFHSWIPETAEKSSIAVTAFLPASLDKLLGIYLLARITMDLFIMDKTLGLLLMIVGSLTIVAAVMMALVQNDLKRLLGYLVVAGAGYMVLGLGTGTPAGIAGGLFYLLNSAIWTACLFLSAGAVEDRANTTDLERLGGWGPVMPITFVVCLVSGLAISGIPPFNGFVSKWMIYQGLIELGRGGDGLWFVWLVAAMFGSALTLACIIRLIHATFLGQVARMPDEVRDANSEVSPSMWLPMIVLAGLCVVFGVFAYAVPLKHLIIPAVPGVSYLGFWSPGLATLLIVVGVLAGVVIYFVGRASNVKESEAFIGGELLREGMRVSGVDFYRTIRDFGLFGNAYKGAERSLFDIYDLGGRFLFYFVQGLRRIHSGILPTYLSWMLVGFTVLLFVFMG